MVFFECTKPKDQTETSELILIQFIFQNKRPDSILKTKPNKIICYQILPIVHQIVDENCRQFLNNYEK